MTGQFDSFPPSILLFSSQNEPHLPEVPAKENTATDGRIEVVFHTMDFKSGPHSEGGRDGERSEVRVSNEHDIAAAQRRRHRHQGVPEGDEFCYRVRSILVHVSQMHNSSKMILFGTPI